MRRLLLLAMALLMVVGCGKKVNMYVSGSIQRGQSSDLHYWGYRSGSILSDPVIEQMTVFINDDSMNVDLPTDFNYWASFYDPDTIPPTVGTEYKFDIKTNVGNATATCTLPGDYDFTTPQDNDSVPANTALIITWNAAAGSDWYAVNVQFHDTLYIWKDTTVNTDSTSWTVPAAWLKKDGWLWIYIYAGNGPKIEPGASGNVNGAKGFCIATNVRYHFVTVGTPTLAISKIRPKVNSPKGFMTKYLQEMSKYNEDAAKMLEDMK
jgi:hypothetical protein